MKLMQQKGQVILALILVMTVALAIGLSIVQKSLVDVSTATKVEESSRAFSAAEGGVEKALQGDSSGVNFSDNQSSAQIIDTGLVPIVPDANTKPQEALEYPPLAKEDIAHVWLADFNSSANPLANFYAPPTKTLDVYWGSLQKDATVKDYAALALTLVYYDGSQYQSRKWYLDNPSATRNPVNNFDAIGPNCPKEGWPVGDNNYQCKFTLSALPTNLMLLRAKLLYNTSSQPFAVQAVGTCGKNCSIPPQARILVSTGLSGETQRRIKVFQLQKVVPPFFDYAIFSSGDLNK